MLFSDGYKQRKFWPVEFVQFDVSYFYEGSDGSVLEACCRILRQDAQALAEELCYEYIDAIDLDDVEFYINLLYSYIEANGGCNCLIHNISGEFQEEAKKIFEKNHISPDELKISSIGVSVKYMGLNGLKRWMHDICSMRLEKED